MRMHPLHLTAPGVGRACMTWHTSGLLARGALPPISPSRSFACTCYIHVTLILMYTRSSCVQSC